MFALWQKGSPHAKLCGEVEISGLPIKCWQLRWFFIDCNITYWNGPPTTEGLTLTLWLIYSNAAIHIMAFEKCWKRLWTHFAHLFIICGSSRISEHTELKICVPNLHRKRYIDEWCNTGVLTSCHYKGFRMFRVRIWYPLQSDTSPPLSSELVLVWFTNSCTYFEPLFEINIKKSHSM